MSIIITNGAGDSLAGWIVQNTTIEDNCFNIQNGYIKQVIGIDGDKRYRQYKLSYNCIELRDRHSYFLFTTTRPPLKKDTYFIPILFDGLQELVFDINEDISDLTFEVIGNIKIKDIDMYTYENISENTRQNIGMWQEVTDGLGNILASKLVGALDSSVANIINANNTMIIEDGLFIRNGSTDEDSTWAMQITSAGWMIADGKNPDGTWNWRTAATGKGLVADVISTGKLSAIDLESVNILASTILGAVIQGGRLEIGDNASKIFLVLDSTLDANYPLAIKLQLPDNRLADIAQLGGNADGGSLILRTTEAWQYEEDLIYARYFSITPRPDGTFIRMRRNVEIQSIDAASATMDINGFNIIRINPASAGGYAGYVRAYGNLYVNGNFEVNGTKNARVETEHFGKRLLYCDESDKVYFSTKGLANTEFASGEYKYILRLDDVFTETIEPNSVCPYIITATAYSNAHVWIDSIYDKYIIFKSDKPCKFAYVLQATRKGYAEEYLREVEK